jgi:aminoglycoside 6'-N-acetyltransferase I
MIEPCASPEQAGWLSLRRALWPEGSDAEHLAEMAEFLALPQRFAQFVAYDAAGQALGFIEASIRGDYVNGTQSSPVAFLEGIYVLPAHRRSGVARSLFEAVAAWALAQGVQEIASDAAIDNTLSHQVHQALGFVETERVVYFRQALHRGGG